MVNVQLVLTLVEIRRVDICYGRVAVPLEEGYARVCLHDILDDAIDIVLYLGVGEVEHELVAVVVCLAVGQGDGPFGMFLKEL